jgi:small-conductance mechanosensitive channel
MKISVKLWGSIVFLVALGIAAAFVISSPPGTFLHPRWFDTHVLGIMTYPIFHLGALPVTLAFLLKAVVFVALLGLLAGRVRGLLQSALQHHTLLDTGQQYAYSRITSYLVFLAGLVIGLESAGVNLNSLLVVGGAVGIGIGLGLQALANNFVSGLVLLFERPIKLGDRIEVGGVLGDVVRMAGRSTWVCTNENVVIIVPNSEFISNRVTNWTANDRRIRFSLPVGVSYDANPEKVRDLLLATAREHPDVLDEPAPDVLFLGFGDSALNFELRVWTIRQVQTPKTLASDLYYSIFRCLGENGIEIPFPQRDLHLKSASAPIAITNG